MPLDTNDRFNLERFIQAQNSGYSNVTSELERGHKQTHWMWFIFPQIHGLGVSATAQRYAIKSLAEAEAYLKHPVLGKRLTECTGLVNCIKNRRIEDVFGYPDYLKLQSSMTLFSRVADEPTLFSDVLQKFYEGQADLKTLEIIGRQ